jgi:hypothetical protein
MTIRYQYHLAKALVHDWLERKRSPQWAETERRFLKEHSRCAACGGDFRVQAHHILPVDRYPELEFDESNLLPLCMSEHECHVRLGHGGDASMKCWNLSALSDADIVRANPDLRAEYEEKARKLRRPPLSERTSVE